MIFDLRMGKKDKELILVDYQTRLSKTDYNRYIMNIPFNPDLKKSFDNIKNNKKGYSFELSNNMFYIETPNQIYGFVLDDNFEKMKNEHNLNIIISAVFLDGKKNGDEVTLHSFEFSRS